jgi:hypothetical protein
MQQQKPLITSGEQPRDEAVVVQKSFPTSPRDTAAYLRNRAEDARRAGNDDLGSGFEQCADEIERLRAYPALSAHTAELEGELAKAKADLATFGNNTAETENRIIDAEFATTAATQRAEAAEAELDRYRRHEQTLYENGIAGHSAAVARVLCAEADCKSAITREAKLREALATLERQALQSTVNDPANEWGQEALAMTREALTATAAVPNDQTKGD